MTLSFTKTVSEAFGKSDYKQMALENRHLRARLSDLISMSQDWLYGPLFDTLEMHDFQEPIELRRAKGTLAGDMRKKHWIKAWVQQQWRLKQRLRKTPAKIRLAMSGAWILSMGFFALALGSYTGWFEADKPWYIMIAAYGGYMAGGKNMWAILQFRRYGIR
jgi:hypothetical protein